MPPALMTATSVQFGPEVTRGSPVAATRSLLYETGTFRRQEFLRTLEAQKPGNLARAVNPSYTMRNHSELDIAMPLDFEQVLLPLLSGVDTVTPSQPDATNLPNTHLWEVDVPVSTRPSPTAFTFEVTETDFSNEYETEFSYGLTSAITLEATDDDVPTLSFTIFGRKGIVSAKTAALTSLDLHHTGSLKWSVFVDNAWANLGNTQIAGEILGFTWTLEGFLFPRFLKDGRDDLDFSQFGFRKRTGDLSMTVLSGTEAADFIPVQRANKTDHTRQAIRLDFGDGVPIDSGTSAARADRYILVDGFYEHDEDSMVERGAADNEGEMVSTAHFVSNFEATAGKDLAISVQNSLAAFP